MKENLPLIYVVEDDEGITEVYEGAFEDTYEIQAYENGTDFLVAFEKRRPALIILDIMLPDMDGYTILTKIREMDEKVPVIIVSAKSDEISFVKGLNKGADDYMSKPFSLMELMARVKTNLRRANLYVTNSGGFVVDNNTYKISYEGVDLGLTLKEFKLFKLLISRAGVTVEREVLFKEVWGESFMGETRTLDMHIATLREKIKSANGQDPIVTVRSIGYRFEGK
ncbi:MAG: response regulator transcription factor [Clostridia bacterium]|nr:response regulator transcription factor [Clostridia bacterium]